MNSLAHARLGRESAPLAPSSRLVHQTSPDPALDLAMLREGLLAPQAHIAPKFFYDPAGCALFDQICDVPEYYLTRTEAQILQQHRADILQSLPAQFQWIDLGCGSGSKSLPWLKAAQARRFVGVDIAAQWLGQAVQGIAQAHPHLEATGVVCDFSDGLAMQEVLAQRADLSPVFFYPGSSLGNFTPEQALRLLQSVRAHLDSAGALLLGVDLVKDHAVLQAAYDDAAGVTAAFNRNILSVVNRLLDADFDPLRFDHHAVYNPTQQRIEMRLRSRMSQLVNIGDTRRVFREGECILTEYSHKYRLDDVVQLLLQAGFHRTRVWTDARAWFGVFLGEV